MCEALQKATTQTSEVIRPFKDFKSVQERERELIQSINPSHCLQLQTLVQEFRDVFPETLCGNIATYNWGCHGNWLGIGQHWYQ